MGLRPIDGQECPSYILLTNRCPNRYAIGAGKAYWTGMNFVKTPIYFLAFATFASLVALQRDVRAKEKLPGFHQINEGIRKAIRRYSLAKLDDEIAESVFNMTELHRELVADPRFTQSTVLQGYRRRLSAKLGQAERAITRDLEKRGEKKSLAESKNPLESEYVGRIVSHQLSLVGSTLGGPSRLLDEVTQRGGFGGRGVPDYGTRLVQLIQSTIAPKAWDVNGGSSTIIYYRPLFLLVVRAPMDVQEDIGGALGKIRE